MCRPLAVAGGLYSELWAVISIGQEVLITTSTLGRGVKVYFRWGSARNCSGAAHAQISPANISCRMRAAEVCVRGAYAASAVLLYYNVRWLHGRSRLSDSS